MLKHCYPQSKLPGIAQPEPTPHCPHAKQRWLSLQFTSAISQLLMADHWHISLGPLLQVTAYRAGHVLGACMFEVEIAGMRLLYTGDYSRVPDRHLSAANTPNNPPHIAEPSLQLLLPCCNADPACCVTMPRNTRDSCPPVPLLTTCP